MVVVVVVCAEGRRLFISLAMQIVVKRSHVMIMLGNLSFSLFGLPDDFFFIVSTFPSLSVDWGNCFYIGFKF